MAKFTLRLDGPSIKIPNKISGMAFDYVSRYQLIAEIINGYCDAKKPKNILDVGGLGSYMSQIVRAPITILDEEAEDNRPSEKRGDGAHMPIDDGAFEAVVTSDTLEHIPRQDRKQFIAELVRASSDLVILCAPFADHGAAKEEAELQQFYKGLTQTEHRWLREHRAYGLSHTKEILAAFEATGVSVISFGHTSIDLWRDLMAINLVSNDMGQVDVHQKATLINKFYNSNILFHDFDEKSYRTFFVASKKKQLDVDIKNSKPTPGEYLKLMRLISDFYLTSLVEGEYVPKIRKRVKDLHDETINLAAMVQEARQHPNSFKR